MADYYTLKVLWDYEGRSEYGSDCLNIRAGEYLYSTKFDANDWVWCTNDYGQEGWAPGNYVEVVEEPSSSYSTSSSSSSSSNYDYNDNYSSTTYEETSYENSYSSNNNYSSSSSNIFTYFSYDEVNNVSSTPYQNWSYNQKSCFEKTMQIVHAIREHFNHPIRLTSVYRAGDSGAHGQHKAVDFMMHENETDRYLYRSVMEWLRGQNSFYGFRVFNEWNGRGMWFHIDRDYKDYGQNIFMIGYPEYGIRNNRMIYSQYDGRTPMDLF